MTEGPEVPRPALAAEPDELVVPTYESSGQTVHPDVVEFPAEWHGWRYWMAMTPYPHSNARHENPSILASADGRGFVEPVAGMNPVVYAPSDTDAYNSDPELLYESATDRLVLFYRQVMDGRNTVRVLASGDGVHWRGNGVSFAVKNHGAVSPTVVGPTGATPARAWYVDAGAKGCGTSAARVRMREATRADVTLDSLAWKRAVRTDLAQPGYVVWHLKVRWVPSKQEYWALYAAYPTGTSGCAGDDLFFARSADGVHWRVYPQPLLRHGDRPWTAGALYRSTFLYYPASDELRVWLSARDDAGRWRMGFGAFRYARLLDRLAAPAPGAPADTSAPRHPGDQLPLFRAP